MLEGVDEIVRTEGRRIALDYLFNVKLELCKVRGSMVHHDKNEHYQSLWCDMYGSEAYNLVFNTLASGIKSVDEKIDELLEEK